MFRINTTSFPSQQTFGAAGHVSTTTTSTCSRSGSGLDPIAPGTQLGERELSTSTTTMDNAQGACINAGISISKAIQNLRAWVDNSCSDSPLGCTESISFGPVNDENVDDIKEFLNLLTKQSDKLPRLTSLSFDDYIYATLRLQGLPKGLTKLYLGHIYPQGDLTLLTLPEDLTSLSIGHVYKNGMLTLPTLPSGLTEFSFGDVYRDMVLCSSTFSTSPASLSFGKVTETLTIEELPEGLKSLSVGDILFKATLRFGKLPEGLESVTLGEIYSDATIELELPTSVNLFSYGKVNNDPAMEERLKELKAQVDARRESRCNSFAQASL